MIKLPAYFLGFNSKSDGSAGLRFGTQELSAEDFAQLKRDQNEFGWLLFQPNNISLEDLPKETAYEDKEKTPSKRMRAVLFVMSQQQGIAPEKFEEFYRERMEKLITMLKDKLDV